LFHPGATHGVLPSEVCSRPEPDTFRLALSCFSLATKTTSRSLAFRLAGLSTSPSLVLACRWLARSYERPFHRTALLAVSLRVSVSDSGFPAPGLFTASLALEPRFRVPEFQESSPEHARFLGAYFTRLPSSHLSWPFRPPGVDSADLGLDFASLSPPVLALAARALAGTSGSRSVYSATVSWLGRSLLTTTVSPSWASYPRTFPCCFGSGPRRAHVFTFERGARYRLAIRSSLPSPHFLPERIRTRLSGHW